jgi:acyl carrier protein
MSSPTIIDDVTAVIVEVLGIEDRTDTLNASTPLFGSMPELDSLAVLELIANLERQFGFVMDDDEFSGEIFDTIGTLAAFVESKIDGSPPA